MMLGEEIVILQSQRPNDEQALRSFNLYIEFLRLSASLGQLAATIEAEAARVTGQSRDFSRSVQLVIEARQSIDAWIEGNKEVVGSVGRISVIGASTY